MALVRPGNRRQAEEPPCLRIILSPGRCKLGELQTAIEKGESEILSDE